MKKIITLAMMMAMTITANAMSYTAAKNEALFLSDKMAYELNLTDAQYDAVYEINLDYLMSVNIQSSESHPSLLENGRVAMEVGKANGRSDAYGTWWNRRNTDLKYVLTAWQYEKFMDMSYFYRPLTWKNGNWTINVYSHYSNKSHFYKAHPKAYVSYKGGNNKKSDRYYADKKVNKPASTPTAKNSHSNNGKNMAGNSNNKKGNTTAKPNDNNRHIAQNTTKKSGSGHFGGRR